MTEEPAGKAGLFTGPGFPAGFLRPCRAYEILKTLEIRPVGLLSRVLAATNFPLIHASMNRVTLVAWEKPPPAFCALRAWKS